MTRQLKTRAGIVQFPTFIPVTTFGNHFPLDPLVRPYLSLLAQAAMVSYPYAQGPVPSLRIPLFVDSGGFACLLPGGRVEEEGGLGVLVIEKEGEEPRRIHPHDVLELQEKIADVAFTLDFPVPPGLDPVESKRRIALSYANSVWALRNKRRKDLPLFAGVQGSDPPRYRESARQLAKEPFDGFAIGGLVPRARDHALVQDIANAVRSEVGDRPLHAFGLGQPDLLSCLFTAAIDSADSSSYLKFAADGRQWGEAGRSLPDPSPTERLHLALCNLATAASRCVPVSASHLVFRTHALMLRRGEASSAGASDPLVQHPDVPLVREPSSAFSGSRQRARGEDAGVPERLLEHPWHATCQSRVPPGAAASPDTKQTSRPARVRAPGAPARTHADPPTRSGSRRGAPPRSRGTSSARC